MGCFQSRESLPIEEKRIVSMEEELNYSSNHCTVNDSIHRKYSNNSIINLKQWTDIHTLLNIQVRNTPACKHIEDFFSSLQENGKFPFKKMTVLAILLGQGLDRQKARLLFELYDPVAKSILQIEEIEEMLDDISDVSIVKLSVLADLKNSLYTNDLLKGFLVLKNKLKFDLMIQSEVVTQAYFIHTITTCFSSLLTPHGFRRSCLEFLGKNSH